MGRHGGSWDSSRDSGWLRRKEIRFLVRSWMAHLSLVPDPQRIYPKSLSNVIFSWNIKKSLEASNVRAVTLVGRLALFQAEGQKGKGPLVMVEGRWWLTHTALILTSGKHESLITKTA